MTKLTKMDRKRKGIYSFFYCGDGHPFYVKVGYSKDIDRRMKEHKMSNPLIEEGPTAIGVLADFHNESRLHNLFKDLFEEIAPEHYKLTVEERMDFGKLFETINHVLSVECNNAKRDLKIST